MNKKVSIIMPFYNAEATITESVHSVLNQSYANFELILIDDGSTDASKSLVLNFDDARVFCFFQKNEGVSAARNVGLKNSTGDYVCFLDADDLMTQDSITSRLALFLNNEQVGIVGGAQIQKNHDLSQMLLLQEPSFRGYPRAQLIKLNPRCFINCGTWLIKKGIIGDNTFPVRWTHSEDLAFFYLISKDAKLDYVKNIVQIYRRSETSAMSNLEGLLDGYSSFIELVKTDKASFFSVLLLKIKVSKIMYLSFRSQKKYLQSFLCIKRILLQ